jgi:hypothetical protein
VHSQRPKQGWKPKDNPDGIGSSKAFDIAAPIQQNDSNDEDALLVGGTAAPTQQKDTSDEIPRLAASQQEDVVDIDIPLAQTVAHEHIVFEDNEDIQLDRQIVVTYENSSLQNVSDDLARSPIPVNEVQPILTLVSDFPNIKNIVDGPDDAVDPMLQKELDSLNDLLVSSATTDIPTPYFSKAQRKKAAKMAYSTRS